MSSSQQQSSGQLGSRPERPIDVDQTSDELLQESRDAAAGAQVPSTRRNIAAPQPPLDKGHAQLPHPELPNMLHAFHAHHNYKFKEENLLPAAATTSRNFAVPEPPPPGKECLVLPLPQDGAAQILPQDERANPKSMLTDPGQTNTGYVSGYSAPPPATAQLHHSAYQQYPEQGVQEQRQGQVPAAPTYDAVHQLQDAPQRHRAQGHAEPSSQMQRDVFVRPIQTSNETDEFMDLQRRLNEFLGLQGAHFTLKKLEEKIKQEEERRHHEIDTEDKPALAQLEAVVKDVRETLDGLRNYMGEPRS